MTEAESRLWTLYIHNDVPIRVDAPYAVDGRLTADTRGICLPAWTTDPVELTPLVRKRVLRTLYENGVFDDVVRFEPLISHAVGGAFVNRNPSGRYPEGKLLVGRCFVFCFPYADSDSSAWFRNARGDVDYTFPTI